MYDTNKGHKKLKKEQKRVNNGMGAATAMANCRSGSFTLSFWSLNIRVNAPSRDMIPDKK